MSSFECRLLLLLTVNAAEARTCGSGISAELDLELRTHPQGSDHYIL